MALLLLIIGFILLIKGADFFVDGASNIATLLYLPPILIGLTIVSLGTSAPEATISIVAAIEDSAGISIGNVVGSNILNITLIIGLTAIIYPIGVSKQTIKKEIPFTFLSGIALLVLMSDNLLLGHDNLIDRSDGIILLLFLCIFLAYVFEVAMNSRENSYREPVAAKEPWGKSLLITLVGLFGIIIGGRVVVDNATVIAYALGMNETLVGLTVMAIGTSLPELVTSITAAFKKETEIALGNIVGSNIFNILFVLGATSVIKPLEVDKLVFTDIYIMLVLTVVLLIFSRTNYKIGKKEGLVLVVSYLCYLVYIIIRN